MKANSLLPLILLTSALLTACPSDPTPTPDMSTTDMQPDMPRPDMPEPDVSPDVTPDMSAGCVYQSDCAEDQACIEGACVAAPECPSTAMFGVCQTAFIEMSPAAADRAICDQGRCKIACTQDTECAQGSLCTDYGLCKEFTGTLTGEHPGAGTRAPLQAGVGDVLMNFPIGLSLGGFGFRGSNEGRYADELGASQGQAHGLYARSIALDNGERQLMLIRLPTIFPTAMLHEAVARKLQEQTGKDWRSSLVISGTHTHSGPGRFLQLPRPEDTVFSLGVVGTDNFNQEVFDWMVESTYASAKAALDDLSPAKFGWEIVESFDVDDRIASDRWKSTPPFDDNRLLLMRVDDMDDKPRALLISFGMHGTFYSSDYATGDAAAGIERALEGRLGQEYDQHVPVLFFNQNGGSMSPRGDHRGHREVHKFEHLGYRFVERNWSKIADLDMKTKTDLSLGMVTHRFPLGYEILGYAPDEFMDLQRTRGNLKYGGIQCTVAGAEDDDYATKEEDPVRCLGLHRLLHNRPASNFMRATISALEIDGLTIVTMPGELTMEMGWQVLRDVQTAHGVDPLQAWTWGYAQDHQFYLTPSNIRGEKPPFPGLSLPKAPDEYPDFAISYFQGGYEPGFAPWGYRLGDFLVARAIEAVGMLKGVDTPPVYDSPLPLEFSRFDQPIFEVDASDPARVGQLVLDVPETVQRLSTIDFGWVGGDPGAEMPQAPLVVLEQETAPGTWTEVKAPNTRAYSNREPLMLTRTRKAGDDWEWLVYWEETRTFPVGTYRFRVQGHYQDAAGARVPYETQSRAFTFAPGVIEGVIDATAISGTIAYPIAQKLDYIGTDEDPGKLSGSYRMRHPEIGSGLPDPPIVGEDLEASGVTIRVTPNGSAEQIFTGAQVVVTTTPETVQGRMDVPVTRFSLATPLGSGTYDVTVEVTDNHSNAGSFQSTVTIP